MVYNFCVTILLIPRASHIQFMVVTPVRYLPSDKPQMVSHCDSGYSKGVGNKTSNFFQKFSFQEKLCEKKIVYLILTSHQKRDGDIVKWHTNVNWCLMMHSSLLTARLRWGYNSNVFKNFCFWGLFLTFIHYIYHDIIFSFFYMKTREFMNICSSFLISQMSS